MKRITSILVGLFLVSGLAFSQSASKGAQWKTFDYIPKTLSAGTAMSARTASTTYDDTTQPIFIRDFSQIHLYVAFATNDSASVLVSYQISPDGSNWGALVLLDSVEAVASSNYSKSVALPAAALGAYQVRFRVYGAAWNAYSANPSATVTTRVVKRP